MNLVIDIGNTRTKAAVFNGREMIENIVFSDTPIEIFERIGSGCNFNQAIVSSVKAINNDFFEYAGKFIKGRVIELNESTPVPVKNLYRSPETLGKDRLAGVIGAYSMYPGNNILVIDAGTAITYDFVNKAGEYTGGNISPGMEMRFKALNVFTGKLPMYSGNEVYPDMGYNTETAIISGVAKGIIFEIEGYISLHTKKYNNLTIIITGGDADFFVRKLKKTIFVVQNLTLTGLNNILLYNEKLH